MKSRLIALVLAVPCLTFAASATDILQHVAAVYRDLRSYEVRVTAQTVYGSDVSERHFAETGSGPGKYRVEFDNPNSELRVGDGQDEWLFRPDTNEYSKTPLAAAGTHIGALAEIDRHVREASIAREEEFLVNGKPVPIYVVNVVRDQWPRGSIEGAEHTMYRIDRETFVVYKAITYSPKATEILLYTIAKWNQPLPEALFHFEPPASARAASPGSALPAPSKPLVGATAPDFTLPDTGGNTVHLREFQGKVIIVDFWATWCPPCRALMPRLQKMYVNWEKRGLVVLGLDVGEDADTVEKFAREQSYSFPLLIGAEPDIAARYFVEAYPSTFVIDRLGHIVYRDLGGADPAKLQAAVEKALGGH